MVNISNVSVQTGTADKRNDVLLALAEAVKTIAQAVEVDQRAMYGIHIASQPQPESNKKRTRNV